MNIRLCNDAAAQAIKQKMRNKSMKRGLDLLLLAWGMVYYFYISILVRTMICLGIVCACYVWSALHGKEHMHDTSTYYTKTDSDSDYVYTSTLDPVSTALDLIDSVNGDIKNEQG